MKKTKAEKKANKLTRKTEKQLKKSTKKGKKAAKLFVKFGKALLKLDDNGKQSCHKEMLKNKKVGLTPTIRILQAIEKLKSTKVPNKKAA